MHSFFTAISPISTQSGVTLRATKYPVLAPMRQQELSDWPLSLAVSFLWSRHLSILEGFYATFRVLYGDHFDKHARGFGQKGLLDFTLLPLLSRKLIADTYLETRQGQPVLNFLAWLIALPIKVITFGVALVLTIALAPFVMAVTLLRRLLPSHPAPSDQSMVLSTQTAYAALEVALCRLELGGIRTPKNIQRLLAAPQNLALVYVMAHLTHARSNSFAELMPYQDIFDFLLKERDFWTHPNIIEHLESWNTLNQPVVDLDLLQKEIQVLKKTLHTANLPVSPPREREMADLRIAQSASRLKVQYQQSDKHADSTIDAVIAQQIRSENSALVEQQTDHQIVETLRTIWNRLSTSGYQDAASKIHLKLLLGYGWSALHDETQLRAGVTVERAKIGWYTALYEIGRQDAPVASETGSSAMHSQHFDDAYMFQKLIEGLAKVHKLCEVTVLTPAVAALKVPCLLRRRLNEYLNVPGHPQQLSEFKAKGVSVIWPALKEEVLKTLSHDFSALYPKVNGQVHPQLLALVEAEQQTDLKLSVPDVALRM